MVYQWFIDVYFVEIYYDLLAYWILLFIVVHCCSLMHSGCTGLALGEAMRLHRLKPLR